MVYSLGSNASGPKQAIAKIVENCVKEIRHMDRIEHDPEAQRIKKLVFDACLNSFYLASPPDDGKTTHVTLAPEDVMSSSVAPHPSVTIPATKPSTEKCESCKSIHDPRKPYDHAPVVLGASR
jgi:hypothetical protein